MSRGIISTKALAYACPEAIWRLDDIDVCCLLNTGRQGSTITESLYRKHCIITGKPHRYYRILRICAANVGDMPYIGALKCNMEALECTKSKPDERQKKFLKMRGGHLSTLLPQKQLELDRDS